MSPITEQRSILWLGNCAAHWLYCDQIGASQTACAPAEHQGQEIFSSSLNDLSFIRVRILKTRERLNFPPGVRRGRITVKRNEKFPEIRNKNFPLVLPN